MTTKQNKSNLNINSSSVIIILISVILAVLISYSINIFSNKPLKLAYVDTAKLMVGFSEANKVDKELKSEDDKLKKQLKEIEDSLQSSIEIMTKEYNSAKPSRKKELQDMLSARNQQVNNYKQANMRKMQTLRENKLKDVIDKVNVFVNEYGKKHKYDIIFGTSAGNIVYANEDALDITVEIIEGLNERYK